MHIFSSMRASVIPAYDLAFVSIMLCGRRLTLLLSLQSYLQIILERLPVLERSSGGIQTQQAARLQELVEFIQSQVHNRPL